MDGRAFQSVCVFIYYRTAVNKTLDVRQQESQKYRHALFVGLAIIMAALSGYVGFIF